MTWSLYILECNDGSLYTGITKDITKRFQDHAEGKGSKFVKAKGAKCIVYKSKIGTHSEALKEEIRIKKMGRKEKLKLINQN